MKTVRDSLGMPSKWVKRQETWFGMVWTCPWQDRAHMKVLLNLLEDMMYENLFDELRTKQQLGYSVGCSTRDPRPASDLSIYLLLQLQDPIVEK